MKSLAGQRVLVVGLARSGLAAARFLVGQGAIVTVTDTRPPAAFQEDLRELISRKVGLELGLHREQTFLASDLIVVSPGVPGNIAPLEAARRRGIEVIPEIELAGRFLRGGLIGITGTNGKTTTTALLGKILEASGFTAFVAGNIGVPLISVVDQLRDDSVVVAELSSFQLEAIRNFHAHVAVLLNLSPNHLDRHPSFDAYVRAKAQIFRNQTSRDVAIFNADDDQVARLSEAVTCRKMFFSRRKELLEGVFISDGRLRWRVGGLERTLMEVSDVRLRGGFNLENVLAAAAAACAVGAELGALRSAVRDFRGVEHRLEFVREIRGVAFYDDSKATSVDAAMKALSTFDHGVHLILGGTHKGAPYTPLRPMLKKRVREILTIGAAADIIARDLAGAAEIVPAGTLETAVRKAFRSARKGDSILLAPACSSFDQFQDFEHRGRVFKELVARLADPGASFEPADLVLQPPPSPAETEPESQAPAPPRGEELHSGGGPQPLRSTEICEPPELEYLYEVSAEEIPHADQIQASDGRGEIDEPVYERRAKVEAIDDELMSYEVRDSGPKSAARPIEREAVHRAVEKAFDQSRRKG